MYELITQYASIMYDRNLKSFGTTVTAKDVISEVYAIGFNTKEDVIKIVRDVIFKEKRRLLASQQQRISRDVPGEKVCNRCHKSKSYSEFYKRFDKRNGFRYLCNNCMECEVIRRSEVWAKQKKEMKTCH